MREDIIFRKIDAASADDRWYYYELIDEQGERLTNALRTVIEKVNNVEVPIDKINEIAAMLEELSDNLDTFPARAERTGFSETASEVDHYTYIAHGPLIGKLNPLAPPLNLKVEGNKVFGSVNFGSAYEGPPGHVHGGYIAAMFDDLLGCAQSLSDKIGVTGTISIRFCAPTPLNTDLRLEGALDRIEGRKIYVTGKMYAGDLLTAEATGICITLATQHYDSIEKTRSNKAGQSSD
jgi:hypothetical protein